MRLCSAALPIYHSQRKYSQEKLLACTGSILFLVCFQLSLSMWLAERIELMSGFATRHGKYFWLEFEPLDGAQEVWACFHLGMSGSVKIKSAETGEVEGIESDDSLDGPEGEESGTPNEAKHLKASVSTEWFVANGAIQERHQHLLIPTNLMQNVIAEQASALVEAQNDDGRRSGMVVHRLSATGSNLVI
jgi:hypothetical protein